MFWMQKHYVCLYPQKGNILKANLMYRIFLENWLLKDPPFDQKDAHNLWLYALNKKICFSIFCKNNARMSLSDHYKYLRFEWYDVFYLRKQLTKMIIIYKTYKSSWITACVDRK